MNYYEHHIGDYDQATAHLTACEDGIYGRLLRKCYSTEKALPNDLPALQRLVRARTRDEKAAVQAMLEEFFDLRDDGWHQKRCDEEIARYQDKRAKAKRSANARWDNMPPQSEGIADAYADGMRTHCEGNAPSPQSPDSSPQSSLPELEVVGGTAQAPTPPPPPFRGESNLQDIPKTAVVPLAGDWELPETWGTDAEALGFTPPEILRESERFRQYWVAGKGAGTRRALKGWRQSWSNWLAKAEPNRRAA